MKDQHDSIWALLSTRQQLALFIVIFLAALIALKWVTIGVV